MSHDKSLPTYHYSPAFHRIYVGSSLSWLTWCLLLIQSSKEMGFLLTCDICESSIVVTARLREAVGASCTECLFDCCQSCLRNLPPIALSRLPCTGSGANVAGNLTRKLSFASTPVLCLVGEARGHEFLEASPPDIGLDHLPPDSLKIPITCRSGAHRPPLVGSFGKVSFRLLNVGTCF